MTTAAARRWLIVSSLILVGASLLFFILAPAFRYPLTYDQVPRLLEIVLPVFLGYLGSATRFLFAKPSPAVALGGEDSLPNLGLLVRGPVAVFAAAMLAALVAFAVTNGPAAPPGAGMTVDMLALAFSSALGLLAVTTNVIASNVFPSAEKSS